MTRKTRKRRAAAKLERWRDAHGRTLAFHSPILMLTEDGRSVGVHLQNGRYYELRVSRLRSTRASWGMNSPNVWMS